MLSVDIKTKGERVNFTLKLILWKGSNLQTRVYPVTVPFMKLLLNGDLRH